MAFGVRLSVVPASAQVSANPTCSPCRPFVVLVTDIMAAAGSILNGRYDFNGGKADPCVEGSKRGHCGNKCTGGFEMLNLQWWLTKQSRYVLQVDQSAFFGWNLPVPFLRTCEPSWHAKTVGFLCLPYAAILQHLNCSYYRYSYE